MEIVENNIYVSITDVKKKEDFFNEELKYNFELAVFALPEYIGSSWRKNVTRVKRVFKKYPVKRNMHGPFFDLAYESKDDDIRAVALKKIGRAIHIASEIGAEHIVCHSTYNPLNPDPKYPDFWLKRSADFWKKLAHIAARNNCMIVMENIFDKNPLMIKRLIREVDSPFFKACLDIGHAHIFSESPIEEWVEVMKKDLYHLHVHDNNGITDEHLGIGRGNINFNDFFSCLQRIRHIPAFTIEVKNKKEVDISLRYLRDNNLIKDSIK